MVARLTPSASNTDAARCGGGWMKAMQFLDRIVSFPDARTLTTPHRVEYIPMRWQNGARRDVLMYVLSSKPNFRPRLALDICSRFVAYEYIAVSTHAIYFRLFIKPWRPWITTPLDGSI
jgi:hypothetical protein